MGDPGVDASSSALTKAKERLVATRKEREEKVAGHRDGWSQHRAIAFKLKNREAATAKAIA